MIDDRLLLLKDYISTKQNTELAEYFGVSPRHCSRLLSTWEKDGFIKIEQDDHGQMNIEIIIDVEKRLFYDVIKEKSDLTLERMNEILSLPWESELKNALMHTLLEDMGSDKNAEDVMIDFVYRIPEEIHPVKSRDLVGAQVNYQTLETLYKLDEQGEIQRNMLRYDEWVNSDLHLYLMRNRYFADGHEITSAEVKSSIDYLRENEYYMDLIDYIESVEVVDKHYVIIHCTEKNELLKLMLSEVFSSIYKTENGMPVGSGPYKIMSKDKGKIILTPNPYYSKQLDVEKIYLIVNKEFYKKEQLKQLGFNNVQYIYTTNEVLLFHPQTNLDLFQRKLITKLFHDIIFETTNRIAHYLFDTEANNYDYPVDASVLHTINRPIKTLFDEFNKTTLSIVQGYLDTYGITLELIEKDRMEYMMNSENDVNIDFLWVSESYLSQEPFRLMSLLQHCKFKDWYSDHEALSLFIEMMKKGDTKNAAHLANNFDKYLKASYYFNDIFIRNRLIDVPKNYLNVKSNDYGFIDYAEIVKRYEQE